jgi:hypothetical protein
VKGGQAGAGRARWVRGALSLRSGMKLGGTTAAAKAAAAAAAAAAVVGRVERAHIEELEPAERARRGVGGHLDVEHHGEPHDLVRVQVRVRVSKP